MSTDTFDLTARALEACFDAANAARGVDALPVGREGVVFSPARDAAEAKFYARLKDLRAVSTMASLGTAGLERHEGIYQVSLFGRSGEGTGDLRRLAGYFANAFSRKLLTAGGQEVQTGVVALSPVLEKPQELQVNLSVPYYTYS